MNYPEVSKSVPQSGSYFHEIVGMFYMLSTEMVAMWHDLIKYIIIHSIKV